MPPTKEPATPTKSPMKKPVRTPKSASKGDELGKNKKQSSIMQFFTPKDKESPLQLVVSKPSRSPKEGTRKALFPSQITDTIVISDEDSPRSPQPSIEQFHAKTKVPRPTKQRKAGVKILSRKFQKLKSLDSPATSTSKSNDDPDDPEVPETHSATGVPADKVISTSASQQSRNDVTSPSHSQDSNAECSPTKQFRKQFVTDWQALDEMENNILKQITPSNKPSLLSTKSRKRKKPETPSPPSLTSPQKKAKSNVQSAENSPVPRGVYESSPKIDQSILTGLERVSEGNETPPPFKEGEGKNDSDENDSSQIFLKSPLQPSPSVKKAEPLKPPALRVKPLLDLLSPRYLTDGLVNSMQKGRGVAGVPGSSGAKTSKESPSPNGIPGVPGITSLKRGITSVSEPSVSKKTANGLGGDRLNAPVAEPPVKQKNSATSKNTERSLKAHSPPSDNPPSNDVRSVSKTCEPRSGELLDSAVPGKNMVSSGGVSGPAEAPMDLDKVDWLEPMEQEIIHASAVKGPQSNDSTPKKINPTSASNKSTPVKFGLLTPSKITATPSKNPTASSGPSRSTPSTPRKSPYKSPHKLSPNKFGSPFKTELTSGNLVLQLCIEECKRYAKMALKLNAYNKKVADDYLSLDHPEKLLLHHLLMRKWSWIRQCDMNYEKFIPQLGNSLSALRDKGFVDDVSASEDLEVILGLLKRPELVDLCKNHKIDFAGMKQDLAVRLLNFANRQSGLGFTTKTLKNTMLQTAVRTVGRCVRIAERPRQALQQIFEASMSPIFLEGNFYTYQERMRGMGELMDSVKFRGKKLVPFQLSDSQLFLSTSQFDEYIASTIAKFEMFAAKERKDTAKGIEFAKDARSSLLIYVNSPGVQDYLNKMPRYVWRYTAGSNYTSALDNGVEFFKKAKDFETAVLALDVLIAQGRFRKHCRGNWYAEKALILDKHMKKPPEVVYNVIMTGLQEDLTPIGHLELSKKAEILLNKKKNGLSAEQISAMRKLMRIPRLNHPVIEIRSIEAPNMSSGTRQTFVEVSADGDRTYLNVEQSARNAYMDEYPEGLHDEGSFVKNVILAAFWPVIYLPKDEMFVSMYQHSPLDWGTRPFYINRKKEIADHIERLREGGIEGVMQQITDVITLYSNSHSLVDWFKVSHDMLPTIKNVITCLTLDKFLLLADYLLEAFRERRSGWPDLTLWNTVAKTFKLVEVKSPNDELSFKQIVWLEKFLEMGIPVEECRVNSSNKNKKRKAMAVKNNSDASQEVL